MTEWIVETHIKKKDSIVIGFAGDVMIGRLVNEYTTEKDPAYIWGDILPLLKETDLNIINLEAALTLSDKELPKVFNFKANPEKVHSLVEASVDVVNLANNHSLDYSEEGLFDTLDNLDKAGIQHVGAGRNIEVARKPVVITKNGIKIGILGFTDNEPSWEATETSPGTRYIPIDESGLESAKQDIQKLRPIVDVLVVTIHWGPNMRKRPPQHFRDFAHGLADAGADVFQGHSAHIFQGVEIYNNKLIMYDNGDFVDDYYVDPILRNDRSFLFLVEVNKHGYQSLRFIPTIITNCQVNRSTSTEIEETINRMQMLSKELGTELYIKDNGLNS